MRAMVHVVYAMVLALYAGASWADEAASASLMSDDAGLRWMLDAGWRQDRLNWNIASDPTGRATPNVLSELRWRRLSIAQVRGVVEAEDRGVVFRASADYGGIMRGVNEDSDYAGNNRTLEWSRSRNDAGAGYVADLDGGLGWRWRLDRALSLTPMIGYAWHRQSLRMRNGVQVVAKAVVIGGVLYRAPPLGPFSGLNSSYDAEWKGPWVGLDVLWRSGAWTMRGAARYERADYRGWANWNMRPDLAHPVSFRHKARGSGWQLAGSMEHRWSAQWKLTLKILLSDFRLRYPGSDTTIFSTGSTVKTRLNGVRWYSQSLMFGTSYGF